MSDNLQAVQELYAALIAAWNARDAAAMANLYSNRGIQVGFDGSVVAGSAEIEKHLAPIFRDHPTATFVTIVRDVREWAKDIVMLRADAGMLPPGKSDIMSERNAIQSLVASRDSSGEWRVELFQNTPAAFDGRPEDRDKMTNELQEAADRRHI